MNQRSFVMAACAMAVTAGAWARQKHVLAGVWWVCAWMRLARWHNSCADACESGGTPRVPENNRMPSPLLPLADASS